jgi:hypothetical protein
MTNGIDSGAANGPSREGKRGGDGGGAESKGKEASNGIIMAYEGVVVDGIYSCSCSYSN